MLFQHFLWQGHCAWIKKIEFKDPLVLAAKKSHFIVNNALYKQSNGIGVGFP